MYLNRPGTRNIGIHSLTCVKVSGVNLTAQVCGITTKHFFFYSNVYYTSSKGNPKIRRPFLLNLNLLRYINEILNIS